jgi:hypothetical protein
MRRPQILAKPHLVANDNSPVPVAVVVLHGVGEIESIVQIGVTK